MERGCTISIPTYLAKGASHPNYDVDVVSASAKMRGAFIPLINAELTYLPNPELRWHNNIVIVNRSLIYTISALKRGAQELLPV